MLLSSLSCVDKGSVLPPSPIVSSVTISSSTDLLKVRETMTFTATATLSDGSSAAVTDWRCDTPAVATVEATTGNVTGVGAGSATVVATHGGVSASKTVRVVPDFGGMWKGEFNMTSCSTSGDWATQKVLDRCNTYTSVGPAQFEFDQNRELVTGRVGYGIFMFNEWGGHGVHNASGPVAGTIDASGHLKLTGAFINPSCQSTNTLTADGNDLYIVADRMVGVFKVDLTNFWLTGRASLGFVIHGDGMTKSQ
jgi:hypothetical protein